MIVDDYNKRSVREGVHLAVAELDEFEWLFQLENKQCGLRKIKYEDN
jgi:hypothetical protein